MTTQYPGALDNFTNPVPTDKLNNPSHASQHSNANDAIEAIQAYLGAAGSTVPTTITYRVVALEAGGGGGGGAVWGAITGTLSAQTDLQNALNAKISVGAVIPWSTISGEPTTLAGYGITDAYTIAQVQAGYLALAGGTLTGALLFSDVATGGTASIDVALDPLSSIGAATIINSPEGQLITSPYIVLNTPNLQTTMPGAVPGALLYVAAIDSFGVVSFGYTQGIPLAYSVNDTATVDVTIKAANAAPAPTTWVSLGLQVTLTEDIPAGFGNVEFEMMLSNPTTRTGVVEYGLQKNGVASVNTLTLQIPANYLQTTAAAAPLIDSFVTGDVVTLVARVTSNSNNQFALIMDATPDTAVFRMWSIGAAGSGGGSGVMSVGAAAPVTTSGGINPVIGMPKATASVDGYLDNADFVSFAAKAPTASPALTGTPTAPTAVLNANDTQIANTAYVTTQIADDAPTKTGGGATGTWPIGISGNANTATTAANATLAATATVALAVDDLNSSNTIKQWRGTVAEYDALGSWDPFTYYALLDGETPGGGGGGGSSVAWDDVTGKPSTFPPSAHVHPISEVTGLQTALDGKLAVGGNAVTASTAAIATAVNDNGAGAQLLFWFGTEAQYQAIGSKDASTVYLRSA